MSAARTLAAALLAAGAFALGLAAREPLGRWLAAAPPAGDAAAAKQLWTCGMHPQVIQDHPGSCPICGMQLTPLRRGGGGAGNPADGGGLTIDPVMVQTMGVRVAEVVEAPLVTTVRAVGTLEEVQPAQHDVNLRVSGWVQKLYASTEGMHLSAGDPLFDVYSPQLEVAVGELIGARRSRAALSPDAPPSARDTADSLLRAAERKLVLLGLQPALVQRLAALATPPKAITIASPVTGHLVARNVVEGSAVEAGQTVMRIVDHRELWLDGRVFEQQIALVAPGQRATAEVSALPGQQFAGEVVFIHPHLDMVTRTATVRIRVPNPRLVLRPGMYGTVRIHVDAAPKAVLAPREAIIDTGRRRIAFLSLGEGRFEPRDVAVGLDAEDGRVQILSGLLPGDRVVTSGQFLLDAESRLTEAIQKHLHAGLLAPPAAPAEGGIVASGAAATPGGDRGPSGGDTGPVAPVLAAPTDEVVRAYLALAGTLAARDAEGDPVDPAALVAASGALVDVSREALRPSAERVRDAAVTLAGQPLPEQRRRFRAVSDAVIALADASPPSAAVGVRLVVMHCPMAEGSWLQTTAAVANPFYGAPMRACGEIARTIR